MAGRMKSSHGWIFWFHVSLLSKQNDKEAKDPGAQAREKEERKHMDQKKRHGPCFS